MLKKHTSVNVELSITSAVSKQPHWWHQMVEFDEIETQELAACVIPHYQSNQKTETLDGKVEAIGATCLR